MQTKTLIRAKTERKWKKSTGDNSTVYSKILGITEIILGYELFLDV